MAVFDIDEMIMPQTANNWHQLLHNVMVCTRFLQNSTLKQFLILQNNLSEKDKKEKAYFVNRHA